MSSQVHLPGKFVWYELVTPDAARAKRFYGELFGWRSQTAPVGTRTYDLILAGDAMIGGYAAAGPGDRPQWIACVSVTDVDAAAKAAIAGGGAVVEPPGDIPTVGRRARITDPAGATIYLYKRNGGDHPDTGNVPAGHFLWNELHTPDPAAALAFYETVVGFEHRAMPMGGDDVYHVIGKGGVDRGGASHHLEPGYPAHWLPYVVADDPDATLARVKGLGGAVRMPAISIPGVGRFGVLADPAGAVLAVMKPMPFEAHTAPG
jgi:predicted enzyme related to lactoylglutathione lyase